MSSRLTQHLQGGVRSLADMGSVQQLSARVWRVLAQNPGPYTLQGTCTYLIGTGTKRLLLDTGDAHTSSEYLAVLDSALQQSGATAGLSGIVISHWHHDHLGGVRAVQAKYGPGLKVYKHIPAVEDVVVPGAGELSISAYASYDKAKFTPIQDGEVITTEGATLEVMHCPGHANDLCVFVLREESGAMFTSDNVLGEGTGVVMNLTEYMASLERMLARGPGRLYPGHGSHLENGREVCHEYIAHRMKRVDQVLQALLSNPASATSLEQLFVAVYGAELPKELKGPAMWNVKMALDLLVSRGKCDAVGESEWRARI